MNTGSQFELGRRLPSPSNACRDRRRNLLATIAKTRKSIAREFGNAAARQQHLTRLALNEAEAIAWQTGFPQLVFPTLAEEKVRALDHWSRRQQSLRRLSPVIKVLNA
jgi:hypothetical protein